MKKLNLLLLTLLISATGVKAQCSGGRYASDAFTDVTTTSNIQFGANFSFNNTNTILKLDFYEPTGDTETKRPLIILAHGGSFIGGSKTDYDMVTLCKAFAKKGYACASIDYRLGFLPFDSVNAVKAVARAVQDMKASIRFFYKDSKEGTNVYKIDTNNIFIGGSSAGALTALHTAYLDKTCELNYYLTPAAVAALGGIEGNSGNPCYSTKVNGVINLCGALARYGYLEAGDLPLVSLHGTADGTVKYNRGIVNPGIPLIYLDGSRMIHEQALAVGVESSFYTFAGAPHVPYNGTDATSLAYMDTTIRFVRDYLVKRLGCTETALQPANAPLQTATLYAYTPCNTNVVPTFCSELSVNELSNKVNGQKVRPNPAEKFMLIIFNEEGGHIVELFDLTGRPVKHIQTTEKEYTLDGDDFNAGTYILNVTNDKGVVTSQSVVFL